MVLLVGGGVGVGDLEALGALQVAQQQVDGGEAAHFVAVFHGGKLVVKAGVVAANDGLDQIVIGLAQSGATAVVHHIVVAKGGTNVGKVYRGYDEHFFVGSGALQGGYGRSQQIILRRVVAIHDKMLERTA